MLTSLGLAYMSPFQPYLAWVTACALVLVILFSGFSVFFPGHWSVSTFLTYYVDIAIFVLLWIVAFFFSKSGIVALQDVDLSEIQDVDREKTDLLSSIESNLPWWRKWVV
jgi:amino acid transporter